MANSEIIGAGQDKERTSCAQEEEKCTDTKCYYFGQGQGCMTSGKCVYEPEEE